MTMTDSTEMFRVIAIGGDHYNTYGIVRSLGKQGIKSDVLILAKRPKGSFVLQSRYVANGVVCLNSKDAVDYLVSNYDKSSVNIVICCSDEAVEMVIDNYAILSDSFILPLCRTPEETKRLMNKANISSFALEFGLAVPKSWEICERSIPEGICFPCLTKPIESTHGRKSDIVVCRDMEELRAVVCDQRRCPDYVVQEYIDYEKEVSILGAVLQNGEVVFSGCIDKLRTCMIGTSSFAVMLDNALLGDNVEKLTNLMHKSGYRGLFSAEFLKKDDTFYFLEVNFRNDGNTFVATASGLNLPYLYVMSCMGRESKAATAHYPCFFMLEIEDFLKRKTNGVSYRQWRKDLSQADCCLVYDKDDIGPFKKKACLEICSYFNFFLIPFRKIGLLK